MRNLTRGPRRIPLPFVWRGARWYVAPIARTGLYTMEARDWNHVLLDAVPSSDLRAIRVILNDYFLAGLQHRLKGAHHGFTPVDSVPWEIHVIPGVSAYKAARVAYLLNRS